MTGRHKRVVDSVLSQPGARDFVRDLMCLAFTLSRGHGDSRRDHRDITIAVGCVGGRHRSVVIADAVVRRLWLETGAAEVVHRDIDKPVLERAGTRED